MRLEAWDVSQADNQETQLSVTRDISIIEQDVLKVPAVGMSSTEQ